MKVIKNNLKNITLIRFIMLCILSCSINSCSINIFSMEIPTLNQEKTLQYDKSLHTLYSMTDMGSRLYVPQKELIDSNGQQVNLRELFKKYNIYPKGLEILWDEDTWKLTYSMLMERTTEKITGTIISSEELPKLLFDAKIILKKFLITHDNNLPIIRDTYIQKSKISRLFTYAKLEQTIKRKNLTHVRLPQKFLIIQDNETNTYVSSEKSPKIIDDILKIQINSYGAEITIDNYNTRYKLIIFAQKEKNAGKLNKVAEEELISLCQEAPFDIGYDNIFADNKGNAIIIDTEFFGESAKNSCSKLTRYRADYTKKNAY